MKVKDLIKILQACPEDYDIRVREGSDKHKDKIWGDLLHGNHSIDDNRKEVRMYSEPV